MVRTLIRGSRGPCMPVGEVLGIQHKRIVAFGGTLQNIHFFVSKTPLFIRIIELSAVIVIVI